MTEKKKDLERRKEIILAMNVIDDDFFVKIAEDVGAMQEILEALLPEEIVRLCWTKAQVHLRNCGTRSVTLDALCKTENEMMYGVEMEKSNKDDHQRRVRYNSSNIDTAYTEKGVHFKDIPELCMIYISKTDFLKKGYAVYHVERVIKENGDVVDNGMREVYVNAKIDDGSKTAQLMKYMKDTQGEHPLFPRLSARVKYLKEEQEGVKEMCEAVEKYAMEKAQKAAQAAAKKAAKEHAVSLFENGVSFEVVLRSITQLTRKELEQIYRKTAVL